MTFLAEPSCLSIANQKTKGLLLLQKKQQTAKELYPMRSSVLCAALVGDCKIVEEYRYGLLYSKLVECYVCPVFGSPIPNTSQIYALFSNRQNIFGEICNFCKLVIYYSTQGGTNIGLNTPKSGELKHISIVLQQVKCGPAPAQKRGVFLLRNVNFKLVTFFT